MKLLQRFNQKIGGYWDGGLKNEFIWEIERELYPQKNQVRVGSWGANYWFHVAVGKSDKLTLSYAKKHLLTRANRLKNNPCIFQYID